MQAPRDRRTPAPHVWEPCAWGPWLLAVAVALSIAAQWGANVRGASGPPAPGAVRRIVSVAPSLTETAAALGLTDRLVGVTSFCDYPPEVRRLPKVGGYLDVNFEAIAALRPDLVLLLDEHERRFDAFDKLGLRTLVVSHKTVDGILASIPAIGRACGVEERAKAIVADLETRMRRIAERTANLPRPRVLFIVDREPAPTLRNCYVAGADDYFERIIELAGGANACQTRAARFPVLSAEALLWMNPEVIIDLSRGIQAESESPSPGASAGVRQSAATAEQNAVARTVSTTATSTQSELARRMAVWRQFPQIDAVAHDRVYVLVADYAFRPSPRFMDLVERLARLIHPEVDWQ